MIGKAPFLRGDRIKRQPRSNLRSNAQRGLPSGTRTTNQDNRPDYKPWTGYDSAIAELAASEGSPAISLRSQA